MTSNPITVHPDQPFVYALHLMYENGFRHMPVVENRPLGLVSARDALEMKTAELEATLHQRQPFPADAGQLQERRFRNGAHLHFSHKNKQKTLSKL